MKNIKRLSEADLNRIVKKVINEQSDEMDPDEELVYLIEDIINSEVYLRDVPYSMQDGDMETDPKSVTAAAKAIVELLKKQGLI